MGRNEGGGSSCSQFCRDALGHHDRRHVRRDRWNVGDDRRDDAQRFDAPDPCPRRPRQPSDRSLLPLARSMSGAGRRRHWKRCSSVTPGRPPSSPAPSDDRSGPRTARSGRSSETAAPAPPTGRDRSDRRRSCNGCGARRATRRSRTALSARSARSSAANRMSIAEISRVGHTHAARRPVDEPDVERRLKLLEAMAHRRFRYIEIAAGSGEPSTLHDADEIAEIVELKHWQHPSVQSNGRREIIRVDFDTLDGQSSSRGSLARSAIPLPKLPGRDIHRGGAAVLRRGRPRPLSRSWPRTR